MDWSYYLCFGVMLHLLQPLVFSVSSMHYHSCWRNLDYHHHIRSANIHKQVQSSVGVQMDIKRAASESRIGIRLSQGF